MILAGIADRLLLARTTLTLLQLAVLFGVSKRTLEHWVRELGFPAPHHHKPGARREWLPGVVREWVLERIRIEESSWDIAAVCAYTGRSRWYWHREVIAGRAPKPVTRALGSGKHLWAIEAVQQWRCDRSGGLPAGRAAQDDTECASPRVARKTIELRAARHSSERT